MISLPIEHFSILNRKNYIAAGFGKEDVTRTHHKAFQSFHQAVIKFDSKQQDQRFSTEQYKQITSLTILSFIYFDLVTDSFNVVIDCYEPLGYQKPKLDTHNALEKFYQNEYTIWRTMAELSRSLFKPMGLHPDFLYFYIPYLQYRKLFYLYEIDFKQCLTEVFNNKYCDYINCMRIEPHNPTIEVN